MKALFVTSATNETIKYGESFEYLGHEIATAKYTNRVGRQGQESRGLGDDEILKQARQYRPDLIVYIGSRWGELLSIDALKTLRGIAPSVHICSDAADQPWWDLLHEYDRTGAFDLQVAIDGTTDKSLKDKMLISLTPFRPDHYPEPMRPHRQRGHLWGYSGNPGGKSSKRKAMMDPLMNRGMVVRFRDPGPGTHPAYIEFMCCCRIVVNFPHTGTQRYMHVKGRVIECGVTGAMLLEQRGSPTADWFTPGVDYMEYGSPQEAHDIVNSMASKPELTEAFGKRLRDRVLNEHGPEKFWARILERLPMKQAVAA